MHNVEYGSNILKFQKLYLKHYGERLDLEEAEKRLNALVGLIEVAAESKHEREQGKDHSVISSQK